MLFDLQNSPSDYLEYRFDGQTGATPLHVAAANGYLSVVEYLVTCMIIVKLIEQMDSDFRISIDLYKCV